MIATRRALAQFWALCWIALWAVPLDAAEPLPAFAPDEAPELTFEEQIAPLLAARCQQCHGGEHLEAGLDVRRRSLLLAGGDSGPAVVLGDAAGSLLIQKVAAHEMPAEGPPLSLSEIDLLQRWVAGGAPLLAASEPPLERPAARFSAEDRAFWAFQPPVRAAAPTVQHAELVQNPIDAFLLEQLEAKGLSFNPQADRATLLRRLCYDLWGLPPTEEQLAAFLGDERPDAYERLVDELLASPHYGEHWGRHWLDVAGYADSDGYLAADRLRPEAWRYRDWVVRALNADLPYDQFVRQQIAGDELYDWRQAEALTPEMSDALIATGFLRTASDPTYPGYTEPNEIHQVLADTVQIVSTALLGQTLQCARCHAHKFDPYSQRDYYALVAVLRGSLDPEEWLPSEVRGIPFGSEAQVAQAAAVNAEVAQQAEALQKQLAELPVQFRKDWQLRQLALLGGPQADDFSTELLHSDWRTTFAGTASGWQTAGGDGALSVRSIDGAPGYAQVRLVRPVHLSGEFSSKLTFRWNSFDDGPATNAAMQGVQLILRDAAGNVVAAGGYIDENNTARGSPLAAIGVGPDAIAQYMSQFGQAVPPDEYARALEATGTATVALSRDATGNVSVVFDDGRVQRTLSGQSTALVTSVEIELRRYILDPGATFEGLALEDFSLDAPATSLPDDALRTALQTALEAAADQRTPEQQALLTEHAPSLVVDDATLAQLVPALGVELQRVQAELDAVNARRVTIPTVRGLMDLDADPRPTYILQRGDWSRPGAETAPGVPEILAWSDYQFVAHGGYKTTGRRTAYVDWLTDPRHPLTARVQVNRMWAQHFGRGLVPTLANFGHTGVPPTHPELLDWLALEFIDRGWSLKSLHRLMLTSAAYRQTSAADARQLEVDPDNLWLGRWQPRRIEGESVRDAILAVSGKLNLEAGGPPILVQPQGDGSVSWSDDPQGNRRSLYLQVRRSQHLTMLELFDVPMMEVNCTQRKESIVPLQALALLNSPAAASAARALAERLASVEPEDEAARLARAYRWLYAREPSPREVAAVMAFLDSAAAEALGGDPAAANADQLAAARRTAWQQAALVLLNANEFVYLD